MSAELYVFFFLKLSENANISTLYNVLKSKIVKLVEKYIPSRIIRGGKKFHKAWVTKNMSQVIKRTRAYTDYCKQDYETSMRKLNTLTDKHKKQLNTAKQTDLDRLNLNMQNSPKELWKFVKSNNKHDMTIPPLICDSVDVTEDFDKAFCFNDYFHSVFNVNSSETQNLRDDTAV